MDRAVHELITIDVTATAPKGLGQLAYAAHPRVGEWVEIEVDDKAFMFEVVMVAHSSSGGLSDLYVRKVAPTSKDVHSLCGAVTA
ncbi:hypothetical protein WM04_12235 [Burkholderia ubonensis]|uniref:hypothetical protein n=1 Tax=Burkholderia ubonensis TaxID=101571 RepID=UPI000753BF1A|nr:hypothetical protein [Burkholderia ubonensis]KWI32843.1 hypothetical protein WM04_12235 [Burkholderia ubonensis]OJB19340.1 hypothetical protein BGV53_07830 [Burkholderia ubonensis]